MAAGSVLSERTHNLCARKITLHMKIVYSNMYTLGLEGDDEVLVCVEWFLIHHSCTAWLGRPGRQISGLLKKFTGRNSSDETWALHVDKPMTKYSVKNERFSTNSWKCTYQWLEMTQCVVCTFVMVAVALTQRLLNSFVGVTPSWLLNGLGVCLVNWFSNGLIAVWVARCAIRCLVHCKESLPFCVIVRGLFQATDCHEDAFFGSQDNGVLTEY